MQAEDPPLKICVVEDEADLRDELVESLQEAGFDVRGFTASRELYSSLLLTPCDIVVLDVGLPGEDGFSIAERLHAMGSLGIIMLTARCHTEDQVRGLLHGADVYLVKPTDLRVLHATIISLARRLKDEAKSSQNMISPSASEQSMTWRLAADGWTLLTPQGAALPLTGQERSFIQYMLQREGQAVAREELAAVISDNPYEYDLHRLESLVSRLRKKAAMHGIHLPLRAVRGAGYLFSASECSI